MRPMISLQRSTLMLTVEAMLMLMFFFVETCETWTRGKHCSSAEVLVAVTISDDFDWKQLRWKWWWWQWWLHRRWQMLLKCWCSPSTTARYARVGVKSKNNLKRKTISLETTWRGRNDKYDDGDNVTVLVIMVMMRKIMLIILMIRFLWWCWRR